MKNSIFIRMAAMALLFGIATAACKRDSNTKETQRQATEMGIRHAAELNPTRRLTDHDIQTILLRVRAKEYEMRQHGLNNAADTYINSFQQHLSEINDSLAQIIF